MAKRRKNPAAVALGRKGGKKRVPKGFSSMTPEKRTEVAKKAATARWGEKQDESLKVHGDPLDPPKKAPAKKNGK